jgi:hypothetical protein
MVRAVLLLPALAMGVFGATCLAQERKPPLPPGRDPDGIAVALISTGIDYTQPAVAARLARDGEGELIGWDVEDHDNRPFDRSSGRAPANWGGDGTELARALGLPGRRLVPVRIKPGEPESLGRAVAFIAQTPARLVVVPMWSSRQSDWTAFAQAAARFSDLLFVAAAGDGESDEEPVWPTGFGLANVLTVTSAPPATGASGSPFAADGRRADALVIAETPRNSRMAAILAADAVAGCAANLVASHKGEALKSAVLAQAATSGGGKPVIERCAHSGVSKRR